ncbi:MAG TPA: AMP-binding protein, partial [Beijerinckiaceae bacterium]|nr:AMP-binding protein [Beijerinckiaceae bacterium]
MPYTAHLDTFARDSLPPKEQWPDLLFRLPELQYPEQLNCAAALLDRWVEEGRGDAPAIFSAAERLTYRALQERVNRIANVLVRDLGLVPGNRVLLRSANNPMMVAAYLAVLKAGGVVVATMPLLRAREIAYPLRKAKVQFALCDHRLADDMEKARPLAPDFLRVVYWGAGDADSLETLMARASPQFSTVQTAADDVCLIAFTSGTTGEPKGTMHFHRDMLAVCDTYGAHVLRPGPDDRFIASPPIAFTYGLGGIVLFPFRVGASTILIEKAAPDDLLAAIAEHRATTCFTAPTAYRAMLAKLDAHDVSSLRACVSAGEALPKATFDAWHEATGV